MDIESTITDEQRLERAKVLGFDTTTIWYHVSNSDFERFDLDKSRDGCIWLTKDLESIKNGSTGASLISDKIYIHKFYLKLNKIGGWDEEDQLFNDQLIQQGFDGVMLDDDIKIFDPDCARKVTDEFLLDNEYNKKTTVYHGNENATHNFSEYKPAFFTTDYNYAKQYGDYVYQYTLDIEKPFDTSVDEVARAYFNDVFVNHECNIDSLAKPLKKGEHISANDADNFWAFLAVEELIGKGHGYDSIVVHESDMISLGFKTNTSIVPLRINQIIKNDTPTPKKNSSHKLK